MDVSEQTGEVFKSVRADVDPVSGNEVPPGALPEEVRDNIDAKLSEGEYVVPADVLRYYGLKFFEDLRNKAKTKMEELDGDGRIGGEPVMDDMPAQEDEELPFDIRELKVRQAPDMETQMAEGGLVSGYNEGGLSEYDSTAYMNRPDFMSNTTTPGASSSGTSEYKKYVNAEGQTMNIRFVGGKPMTAIPPGYKEASASDVTESEDSNVSEEGFDSYEYAKQQKADRERAAEQSERFKDMTPEELSESLAQSQKSLGAAGKAAGLALPGAGLIAGLAGRADGFAIARAARDGYMNATTQAEKDAYAQVHMDATMRGKEKGEGILGGGGLLGGGGTLNDVNNDGKIDFGDTLLGDLLGFDGKGGVQGPDVGSSWNGARRTGGTGKLSKDLGESGGYDGEAVSANEDYDFSPEFTAGFE